MKIFNQYLVFHFNSYFFSAYSPKFDEIPKNDDTYWKNSTIGIIMYGVSDESENQSKVKLYRNKNSDFVRVHNTEDNSEYIHLIDENGLLKHGINRYNYPSMGTSIGSRYFRRGDRKESREYSLYRFNESGNIIYEDYIKGKEDKHWRLLKKYEYKTKTLSWVKVE